MENYIKIKEECVEPLDGSRSPVQTKVNQRICVTGDSKFYQVVRNACKCLKDHTQVILLGEGSIAQKVISISEKIKETCSFNVTDCIEIFDTEYKDLWVPKIDNMGLGNLEVTRAVPTTKILLKYEEGESANSCNKKPIRHRTVKQHTVKSISGNKHFSSKSEISDHNNGLVKTPCGTCSNEDSSSGNILKRQEKSIPNKKVNNNNYYRNTREKSQNSEKQSHSANNNNANFIKQTKSSSSEGKTTRQRNKKLQYHSKENSQLCRTDCNSLIATDDEK